MYTLALNKLKVLYIHYQNEWGHEIWQSGDLP